MLKGVGLVSNGVTRCATADSQVPNNVFYFELSALADVAAPAATVILSEKLHLNQVTQVTSVNLFGKSALVAGCVALSVPEEAARVHAVLLFLLLIYTDGSCCHVTTDSPFKAF